MAGEQKTIIAYKGMDENMRCRGYQYEVGKTYEHKESPSLCESGFHACEHPLDVFNFYPPAKNRFFEVEQAGEIVQDEQKTASSKLTVKAEIGIVGLVKAAIGYAFARAKKVDTSIATGDGGASSATGDCGASSATGDSGASSATGDSGASSATGDYGASSATGDCGASSATGFRGASSATGFRGASSATGFCGASSATGDCGASSATGACGIAVAWGFESRALVGNDTAYMVLSDWRVKNGARALYKARIAKAGDVVCRKKIRANVWYWFENGKLKSLPVKQEKTKCRKP